MGEFYAYRNLGRNFREWILACHLVDSPCTAPEAQQTPPPLKIKMRVRSDGNPHQAPAITTNSPPAASQRLIHKLPGPGAFLHYACRARAASGPSARIKAFTLIRTSGAALPSRPRAAWIERGKLRRRISLRAQLPHEPATHIDLQQLFFRQAAG